MTETETATEPKSLGMKVVLNNGKLEMNSASIPIQWFFDEATIAKNPTHILIVEQNEYEAKRDDFYTGIVGERYGCKVSEGVRFIQFLKPGCRKISVYALRDTQDASGKLRLESFLMRSSERIYNSSLLGKQKLLKLIEQDGNWCGIIAFATIDIEVPRELFAEKPKTALGKAVWWWTNLLFEKKLRDECHYRKRAVFAFTIQPILMLLVIPLVTVFALVCSAYVLLGSFFCLFFGFRPEPIKVFKDSYNDGPPPRVNLLKYRWENRKYRLWSASTDGNTYMPVTGIEIALACASIYAFRLLSVYYTVHSPTATNLLISFVLTLFSLIIVIWTARLIQYVKEYVVNPQARKAREKEEKQRKAAERELEKARYQKWLHETLIADGIRRPTAYTTKERLVQRFYVGYWTLVAKVCKPFAR